jgi:hypothetical protein
MNHAPQGYCRVCGGVQAAAPLSESVNVYRSHWDMGSPEPSVRVVGPWEPSQHML